MNNGTDVLMAFPGDWAQIKREATTAAIARACHEAIRAICVSCGHPVSPHWDDAPDWMRTSVIKGVEFHMANPDASPSASHDAWMAERLGTGWVFGPEKDEARKTHPCLVPFDQLPPGQQVKDHVFKAIVDAFRPFVAKQSTS